MKRLIVNADDFGYNIKVNQGIIEAHRNGIVTSTSLMTTKEAFDDAVRLLKENPRLSAGVHLDLDEFFDVDQRQGIIRSRVTTPKLLADVEVEIRRQIDKIKSVGVVPDHISSHHQVHLIEDVFPLTVKIAKEYGIGSVRIVRKFYSDPDKYFKMRELLRENGLASAEYFIEGWYWGNVDENFSVAELVTHPGYGELWREYELCACCDSKLKNYLREKNIQLITYTDLIQSKG